MFINRAQGSKGKRNQVLLFVIVGGGAGIALGLIEQGYEGYSLWLAIAIIISFGFLCIVWLFMVLEQIWRGNWFKKVLRIGICFEIIVLMQVVGIAVGLVVNRWEVRNAENALSPVISRLEKEFNLRGQYPTTITPWLPQAMPRLLQTHNSGGIHYEKSDDPPSFRLYFPDPTYLFRNHPDYHRVYMYDGAHWTQEESIGKL